MLKPEATAKEEFLTEGWRQVRENVGPHWWSTMRLAGRVALHRSATHRARGTEPAVRDVLRALPIPRTCLLPAADGPLAGAGELVEAGVELVPVPDCGHNIMLDNLDAFAEATAHALRPAAPTGAGPNGATGGA